MQRVFNPADQQRPYFLAHARPEALLGDSVRMGAHVPGRHLNALLTAEEVLGVLEGEVERLVTALREKVVS